MAILMSLKPLRYKYDYTDYNRFSIMILRLNCGPMAWVITWLRGATYQNKISLGSQPRWCNRFTFWRVYCHHRYRKTSYHFQRHRVTLIPVLYHIIQRIVYNVSCWFDNMTRIFGTNRTSLARFSIGHFVRRRRRATPYFFSTSCYLIRMT